MIHRIFFFRIATNLLTVAVFTSVAALNEFFVGLPSLDILPLLKGLEP